MAEMNVFTRSAGERVEVVSDDQRLIVALKIINFSKGMEGDFVLNHDSVDEYTARITEIGIILSTKSFTLVDTYEVQTMEES